MGMLGRGKGMEWGWAGWGAKGRKRRAERLKGRRVCRCVLRAGGISSWWRLMHPQAHRGLVVGLWE